MRPLLEIENLELSFRNGNEQVRVLQGISLQVQQGETVALVGESGSGKSVTALSILQLLPAATTVYNRGTIRLHHRDGGRLDMLSLPPSTLSSIRGREVAMIFQEPMTSLNPVYTCGAQVMEVLQRHKGMNRQAARATTLQLFEQVRLPQPATLLNRYPHQLSGGQKQRVMIAMAMSCQPALLIADEPTTALDVTVQKNVLELMKELQQQSGTGLLFITHDLGIVEEIADRVVVLYKGSIAEEGPAAQVLTQPGHPYPRALLACRPALNPKGKPLPVVADFLPPEQPVNSIATRPVAAKPATTDAINEKMPPLLSIRNLQVAYSDKKPLLGKRQQPFVAVRDVSFDIFPGETVGLVGESGCGKTTLGRSLLRLVEATSGQVLLKGADLLAASAAAFQPRRKDLQIVFQDPYSSLNPRIRIGEAIMEPMQVHGLAASRTEARERAARLLEQVGLQANQLQRYPHEFSGGQRQRLVIARALALHPSFIVWDESVSALDVSVQAQVLNLLNELKQSFGFTSLFISHDLAVVRYICDRILVMQQGQIVESGQAEQIWQAPQHPYTRQLLEAIPGRRRQLSS